jgi:ComF family protein
VFEALKDLLFPPACLGCERRLDHSRPPLFCADCQAELAFVRSPLCPCCGTPYVAGGDHLCPACLDNRYAFDAARSLLFYQPPVDRIIRALKFGGQLTALATLGALAGQADWLRDQDEPDLLLPVPLHPDRLRERGFNQALALARGCFPQWRKKISTDVLLRVRSTTPQSQLSGKERRANLGKAFALSGRESVAGKRVLLVDDVFTTGSTVHECGAVLRAAGAARIEVFTVARSLAR